MTLKDELEQLVHYCFYNKFESVEEALEWANQIIEDVNQGTMIDEHRGIAWVIEQHQIEEVAEFNDEKLAPNALAKVVPKLYDQIHDYWMEHVFFTLDGYNLLQKEIDPE